MKDVTIGGARLGGGAKNVTSRKNFERSTHDLSYKWRSSMAAGTLVPFMSEVALIGDSWDIDLACDVVTLPTIGPLFGSFKVQLDVFYTPIRLYIASLHMNRLGIGNNMADVPLPLMELNAVVRKDSTWIDPNGQVNPSSLLKYLGISGIGLMATNSAEDSGTRQFNALSLINYYDICKNYYCNKQEDNAQMIHTSESTFLADYDVRGATIYDSTWLPGDQRNILANETNVTVGATTYIIIQFRPETADVDPNSVEILVNTVSEPLDTNWGNFTWDDELHQLRGEYIGTSGTNDYEVAYQLAAPFNYDPKSLAPTIVSFPLENIDDMRLALLQHSPQNTPYVIDSNSDYPYGANFAEATNSLGTPTSYSAEYSQEGLMLKTYQSDLFNNWIDTDWIDGVNGVNAVTAVDTTGDSFTIDALNLASKVYAMLNRIAISGGTYDDWKEAVYNHYGNRSVENPIYMGSLIRELAFEEVISTAEASSGQVDQALGTLAGRGRLTQKNKGGKIRIKCDDIGYIMGIVSLTPRIEYSQGNKWDMNLLNMDDFHKPDLDRIGYQDLIAEQMDWRSTYFYTATQTYTQQAVGKQPAWLNYMTNVDRCYGNFADPDKEMFMVLNRRYDLNQVTGGGNDFTTYIDPTKFNHIFADTKIDSQNFWVHIGANVKVRRKMSAKIIPNL